MSMSNIEHVVVLMLENRSFDSLLGWLYEKDTDPPEVLIPADHGPFRGLKSVDPAQYVNHADNGLSCSPVRGAVGYTVPSADPGEAFKRVNMQYFGTATPAPGAVPTMTGFLQDFVTQLRDQKYSESDIKAFAGSIMQTYTPSQLPVLNQLARHYAVCDDWFASVPSQTNPNRAFLMTGTSHGLVDNGQLETDQRAKDIEAQLGMGIGDDRFPESTIFNALAAANTDWAVFWQTGYLPKKISTLLWYADRLGPLLLLVPALRLPLAALMGVVKKYSDYLTELSSGKLSSNYTRRLFPAIQQIPAADQHFKSRDDFHTLARSGALPAFSYLEPTWTIAQSATDARLKNLVTQMGNDYHPPGNVVVGEAFVRDVYSSLIANTAAWDKTLLIITFDEAVGSFDHVAPPRATPPWKTTPPFTTNGFAFDRFGARVPTILVSPWIHKGTVFSSTTGTPYDHTSVISTVLKWLNHGEKVPSFGERTAAAPTFENVLTLPTARTDAAEVGFLKTSRDIGDPVLFGDSVQLKNEHGVFLTGASRTLTSAALPLTDDLMGFAVDLDLAAWFPTVGNGPQATVAFTTAQPDGGAVKDGSTAFVVTTESDVGAANFLGAWRDGCYYYNNYTFGDYVSNESWIVRQADRHGQPLLYGDAIHLENVHFAGQRLARSGTTQWVTTATPGDRWVVLPTQPGTGPARTQGKVELFADERSIGWLGQDSHNWCVVVASSDAAVQLTSYWEKGVQYYRRPSGTLLWLSVSDPQLASGEHKVGFYDWHDARGWQLSDGGLRSSYTNSGLSYRPNTNKDVCTNASAGYTPLTVVFH
ncbi:MAG: alkaline phosphatase family protein [Knoellia sp.]